jgi:hypothetical protein
LDSFDLMSAQPKPRISTRFIYPPAPAKGLDAWCAWLRQEAANVRHTAIARLVLSQEETDIMGSASFEG